MGQLGVQQAQVPQLDAELMRQGRLVRLHQGSQQGWRHMHVNQSPQCSFWWMSTPLHQGRHGSLQQSGHMPDGEGWYAGAAAMTAGRPAKLSARYHVLRCMGCGCPASIPCCSSILVLLLFRWGTQCSASCTITPHFHI